MLVIFPIHCFIQWRIKIWSLWCYVLPRCVMGVGGLRITHQLSTVSSKKVQFGHTNMGAKLTVECVPSSPGPSIFLLLDHTVYQWPWISNFNICCYLVNSIIAWYCNFLVFKMWICEVVEIIFEKYIFPSLHFFKCARNLKIAPAWDSVTLELSVPAVP